MRRRCATTSPRPARPKVVAAGAGLIADRIVEIAREQGVPVREDPALAEALVRLELEQEIPSELFVAVAEVARLGLRAGAQARVLNVRCRSVRRR